MPRHRAPGTSVTYKHRKTGSLGDGESGAAHRVTAHTFNGSGFSPVAVLIILVALIRLACGG